MSTTTRVCKVCREKINITLTNLNSGDFVKYKNSYCHTDCFVEQLKENINKQNKFSAKWQGVLDNLDTYKSDARDAVKVTLYREMLNEYLIDHYDVATLSSYFWNVIAEIENGQYRKKRCKKINTSELLEMWTYYQQELDKIYKDNLKRGNEIIGEGRALYDLAIIMKNYERIKKGIAKEKVAIEETRRATKTVKDKINYMSVGKKNLGNEQKDICSLMDEIF